MNSEKNIEYDNSKEINGEDVPNDKLKVVKVKYPDGRIKFLGFIPKNATIIIDNDD